MSRVEREPSSARVVVEPHEYVVLTRRTRMPVAIEYTTIKVVSGEKVEKEWDVSRGMSKRLYDWRVERKKKKAERKADKINNPPAPMSADEILSIQRQTSAI